MSEAILRQTAGQRDYTPVAATLAGVVLLLADLSAGIVVCDLAAGQKGSVYTKDIFDVAAASATVFVDGEPVYFDVSARLAINSEDTEEGDFLIGSAVGAKASGALVVRVDLNANRSEGALKILELAAAKTLTVADLDSVVFGDTQAGAFSLTLPPAANCQGRGFTFIRAGTGVNALTIDGNASETIDGAATHATMDAARDTISIVSNGANWFLTAARIA
jgi:predicted RecA/RadA family phage recombinase